MIPRNRQAEKLLTVNKKREILKCLQKGSSVGSLSQQYGVSKSTICGIKKWSVKMGHRVRKIEIIEPSGTPRTEEALCHWLRGQKDKNSTVTIASLCVQAKRIHDALAESAKFNATSKWMDNFKRRHGVWTTRIHRHKVEKPPQRDATDYTYKPEQMYRADQMTLLWRVMPGKASTDTPTAGRTHYEHLTFFGSTNLSGTHKLKPLVVGTTYDSGDLNDLEVSLFYRQSDDGRMTREHLSEWFFGCFVKEVLKNLRAKQLPRRAILLLDHSVCRYPPVEQLVSKGGSIKTLLLSTTMTVDRTVIELVRLEYKKRILSDVISYGSKLIGLREAIVNIGLAWEAIEAITIENCWKKIIHDHEQYSAEDYTPLNLLKASMHGEKVTRMEIRVLLDAIEGGKEISDSELDSWLMGDEGVIPLAENVDGNDWSAPQGASTADIECMDTLLGWAPSIDLGDMDPIDMALREFLHFPAQKRAGN